MLSKSQNLAHSYLDAKQCVIAAGYAYEIDWQEGVCIDDLTETRFLQEYTWVVFSSGFRESVLNKKFDSIASAFMGLSNADLIAKNSCACRKSALNIFGHRGKVSAVLKVCEMIQSTGFDEFTKKIKKDGVAFIDSLPYMGPATSYHLAKNIGLDVIKPDRHLIRIAQVSGYKSPHALCATINQAVGDTLAVIDLVIWRYATLHPKAKLPGFSATA